jgi:hypothetical protein
MRPRHPRVVNTATALAAAVLALALALAGCGGTATGPGTGAAARTLLKQTFAGEHTVNSGILDFSIKIKLRGSRTFTQPVSLTLGGPFQSRGKNQLPESDFAVSLAGEGHSGSLQILSTGTAGYVAVGGTDYQLPLATYQKLESSFASVAQSGNSSGGQTTLSKLGIDPLQWLKSPEVVGSGTVGGASAIDVSAGIDMPNLLTGIATVLDKASAAGIAKLPSTTSLAELAELAEKVNNPTVNLWTGASDHTLRRLTVSLAFPLPAQLTTYTGGATSATLALTLGYSDINQPQSVSAPTSAQPYADFLTKFRQVVTAVETTIATSALSGAGATGGTATTGASGAGAGANNYNSCMDAAGNNVAKMQQCVSRYGG